MVQASRGTSGLPPRTIVGMAGEMNINLIDIIQAVVARAPAWLRHDLAAADPSVRARAEDAMAAMIAEAIARHRAAKEVTVNL